MDPARMDEVASLLERVSATQLQAAALRLRAASACESARVQQLRSRQLRAAGQRAERSPGRSVGVAASTEPSEARADGDLRAVQVRLHAAKAAQARRAAKAPTRVDRVLASAVGLVQESLVRGDTALAADALDVVDFVASAACPRTAADELADATAHARAVVAGALRTRGGAAPPA